MGQQKGTYSAHVFRPVMLIPLHTDVSQNMFYIWLSYSSIVNPRDRWV